MTMSSVRRHRRRLAVAGMSFALALVTGAPLRAEQCAGDCNGDGQVSIGELVTLVRLALGQPASAPCPAWSGRTPTIADLVTAVHSALVGCAGAEPTGPAAGSTPAPSGDVVVHAGSASGAPGSTVSVAITLGRGGVAVQATRNEIALDPAGAATIGARRRADGTLVPDCKATSGLAEMMFLPKDCIPGSTCSGLRATVLNTAGAFEEGATLYSCPVAIGAGAAPGSRIRVHCATADYGDSAARSGTARCTDGEITVR